MPDLDLDTAEGVTRVFELLHEARPVLLDLGARGGVDLGPWADRVRGVEGRHHGTWELPVVGEVTAPSAVLIRPDGHVAWVGGPDEAGLADALGTWFGTPAAVQREGPATPGPVSAAPAATGGSAPTPSTG